MIKYDKIHVRVIDGYYQRIRVYLALLFYGAFFLLPWIEVDGRQSILFDFANQNFFILDAVFFPKDLLFLTWGLLLAAFLLFAVTNVLGRVWCGFACPQTLWTLAFVWVENKIEGSAAKRAKAERAGQLTQKQRLQRVAKHIVWVVMAMATGATIVSYFVPASVLYAGILQVDLSATVWFWLIVFSYLTYLNAGLLREKVCLHMCPYSRFQSVMYDADTISVAYDPRVGEPRGSLKNTPQNAKNTVDQVKVITPAQAPAAGGCIDCSMCVQVCPTGIDIREGSQIDCINCGLCIDACDSVMASIGREPDLIKFTSQNQLAGGKSHLLRPRSIGYLVAVLASVMMLSLHFLMSSSYDASIVRERGRILPHTAQGHVTNAYLLKLQNKGEGEMTFVVDVASEGFTLVSGRTIGVKSGEMTELPILIAADKQKRGSYPVEFVIRMTDVAGNSQEEIHESRFLIAGNDKVALNHR